MLNFHHWQNVTKLTHYCIYYVRMSGTSLMKGIFNMIKAFNS